MLSNQTIETDAGWILIGRCNITKSGVSCTRRTLWRKSCVPCSRDRPLVGKVTDLEAPKGANGTSGDVSTSTSSNHRGTQPCLGMELTWPSSPRSCFRRLFLRCLLINNAWVRPNLIIISLRGIRWVDSSNGNIEGVVSKRPSAR